MDGAAAARWRARATQEHLQDRRRLRVRFIVGILPLDADDVAEALARPMTLAAHLLRGTQVGDAWNRSRILPRDDVIQLPHAVQLVLDERAAAFADVALHAGDLRMRRVLPRRELRVHRRVARLAAERGRLHRVQRAVAREQHDHDIDRRQRHEHQRPTAGRRRPEIDDEPLPRRAGVPHQPAVLEPHAERNQQQPEDDQRRQRDEHDQPGVRIVEEPERAARSAGR